VRRSGTTTIAGYAGRRWTPTGEARRRKKKKTMSRRLDYARRSGTTTIAATQAGRRDDCTQAKNGTHAPMERTRRCPDS
jgi:hypothetical protein